MAYTDIDDPSEYFTTLLYTGNATDNRNLTNSANAGDFQPDWLWLKERTATSSHMIHDSNRGTSQAVFSDTDGAQDEDTNRVQAFQTNGFQVGTASTVNQNTITMVAWQWKCNGGTKADNDDGSVTVDLQVNQEAGFSIGTYTGTGSELTVGHGLGAVPKLHITKKLNAADAWNVYHESLGNTHGLRLNNSDAKEDFGFYGDTSPTSSVFTVGGVTSNDRLNTNGGSYVFYSFAEKQGYSRFGSYVGNANANGTFVYLGFKPAWVLIKKSSGGENWSIVDNKRSPFNVMDERLVPNSSAVEESNQGGGDSIDFVSNGFKCRDGAGQFNDANTYVYMAFAEHPFVSSEGVPTTAR
tara:strand:+ start:435 stop:1496 length:1062 start_codon:yes stop_codon:yes gene_type:complete